MTRGVSKWRLPVSTPLRFTTRWQGRSVPTASLSAPPHSAGGAPAPQVRGNVAVGGDAARRNLGDNGPDALEEGSVWVGTHAHGAMPTSRREH